jgi:hypothetical protein
MAIENIVSPWLLPDQTRCQPTNSGAGTAFTGSPRSASTRPVPVSGRSGSPGSMRETQRQAIVQGNRLLTGAAPFASNCGVNFESSTESLKTSLCRLHLERSAWL